MMMMMAIEVTEKRDEKRTRLRSEMTETENTDT
jgi:hypothetical protein